jgi:dolichyl-phosphate-mannose--protein O-mannosyl transferase
MHRTTRDFVGWVVVAVLALAVAAPFGQSLRVLPVVGIFVLFEGLKVLVTRFGLPNALVEFVPAVALLCLSGWLVVNGESSVVAIVTAFAGGWILNTSVRDFRSRPVD